MFAKTTCPIDRTTFLANAKPVSLAINGANGHQAQPQEFSTKSLGWHFGDKVFVEVNGVQVKCQVNVTITAIGSKELPPA
jgi:hypothetical protein